MSAGGVKGFAGSEQVLDFLPCREMGQGRAAGSIRINLQPLPEGLGCCTEPDYVTALKELPVLLAQHYSASGRDDVWLGIQRFTKALGLAVTEVRLAFVSKQFRNGTALTDSNEVVGIKDWTA